MRRENAYTTIGCNRHRFIYYISYFNAKGGVVSNCTSVSSVCIITIAITIVITIITSLRPFSSEGTLSTADTTLLHAKAATSCNNTQCCACSQCLPIAIIAFKQPPTHRRANSSSYSEGKEGRERREGGERGEGKEIRTGTRIGTALESCV